MLKQSNSNRDMYSNDQLPSASLKSAFGALPRTASGSQTASIITSARAMLPPSSCSTRGRLTQREVVGSSQSSGSGLTLSESIRQSGKVFEEQEQKVRQLSNLAQEQAETIRSREMEIQNMTFATNERLAAKQKEIESLREKERASEMAIRGLEDEIKLLRKQNNEIDKLWRSSDDKLRMTNEDLLRKGARDQDAASKFRANADNDGPALAAAENQIKSLKRQVQQLETESESSRQLVAGLQQKVHDLEEKKASGDKLVLEKAKTSDEREKKAREVEAAHNFKISELEKQVASLVAKNTELEKSIGAKDSEIRLLKEQTQGSQALRDEISSLKEKILAMEKEAADLKAQLAASHEKVKSLEHNIADSESNSKDRDMLRKKVLAQEQERRDMEEAALALQRTMASQREEVSSLTTKVSQLESKISQLERQLADASKEGAEAKGETDKLRALVDSLQKRCKELEAEASRPKAEAANPLEETVRDLQHRLDMSLADQSTAEMALALAKEELAKARAADSARQSADSEALARLCRIRELEAELRGERQAGAEKCAALQAKLEELEARCRGAAGDDARAGKELEAARRREEESQKELAELRRKLKEGAAAVEEAAKQAKLLDLLKKRNEMQAHIHRLQMLMRMAEITKLEEYVKCSRRYDAVREEKLGLLTYNLASAESNMAPEGEEAARKRIVVREERMAALMKKQKTEEDKMKTNDESYISQTKRLKEKLEELESSYAALTKEIAQAS